MDELHNHHTERKSDSWEWLHTNEQVRRLQKHSRRLHVVVAVLLLGLIGAVSYGYVTLQKHNIQLSELPGVRDSMNALAQRLDATEAQFRTWSADWSELVGRVDKLDRKVAHNRQLARKQAQEMTAQLQERLATELAERERTIDARFSRLEATQETEHARLAQLQEEITGVRQTTGHDLGVLHQQVARGQRNLSTLAQQLQRRRVDFELAKQETRELAAGVSLRITKTDRRFQRAKGWLWLMPDRRAIWVRDLGVQQSLVFYHKESNEPNELVLTRVTDSAVIGYLLLPAHQDVSISATPQRNPIAAGSTTGAK
jgi:hypothetical protein